MHVLINRVFSEATGRHRHPWVTGSFDQSDDFDKQLAGSLASYKRRYSEKEDEILAPAINPIAEMVGRWKTAPDIERWIVIYRIERDGDLIHSSQNREAALREIAWRGWRRGENGVEIVEQRRKGETMWGVTSHPHRYGAPWPPAKLTDFARLYRSGMSQRDLERHFDCAASMLGKKRKELGIAPRSPSHKRHYYSEGR